METYNKEHLKNIQTRIEKETGVTLAAQRLPLEWRVRRMAFPAACMLCFVILSAVAFAKLSDRNGEERELASDSEVETAEVAEKRMGKVTEQMQEEGHTVKRQTCDAGDFAVPGWIWPTVSQEVSAFYGAQENGSNSDHINIAGTLGDDIYAVADGTVTEVAFEALYGNVAVVDLGGGISVRYGHLKEINVSEGDAVSQGQVIGTLGQSGMATGPNLSFAVTVDGEEVNPFSAF